MSRVVVGLASAALCDWPKNIPVGRPRGRKAAGVRYEKDLAKALPKGLHGQWFQFRDRNGPGWCQPDLLLAVAGKIAILEAKYTWVEAGHRQVELLYRPVVGLALGRETFGLVVCRTLTRDVPKAWVVRTLEEGLLRADSGLPTVLHWVGAALSPFQPRPTPSHLATGLALL